MVSFLFLLIFGDCCIEVSVTNYQKLGVLRQQTFIL